MLLHEWRLADHILPYDVIPSRAVSLLVNAVHVCGTRMWYTYINNSSINKKICPSRDYFITRVIRRMVISRRHPRRRRKKKKKKNPLGRQLPNEVLSQTGTSCDVEDCWCRVVLTFAIHRVEFSYCCVSFRRWIKVGFRFSDPSVKMSFFILKYLNVSCRRHRCTPSQEAEEGLAPQKNSETPPESSLPLVSADIWW